MGGCFGKDGGDPAFRAVITDADESIKLYSETLGVPLKFRDGGHFAALDGGSVTLALATAVDHPILAQVVVGIKTDDVDRTARAIEATGGGIVKGPYDDAPSAGRWSTTTRAMGWCSISRWGGRGQAATRNRSLANRLPCSGFAPFARQRSRALAPG